MSFVSANGRGWVYFILIINNRQKNSVAESLQLELLQEMAEQFDRMDAELTELRGQLHLLRSENKTCATHTTVI